MALSRVKVWVPGDILTASDLNGEFNNLLNNPISLISPTTGVISFSTAQTFPAAQVTAGSTQVGEIVSVTSSGGFTAGTVVTPGTAPLQFNSTVQLQLGLGTIPLRVGGVWVQRAVPTAVTISATSTTGSGALVANTNYFAYAFDNAGATGLEFRTTSGMPHSRSTENGTEVGTTDATRTLVGLVRTNASTQFSNVSSQRYVASWYGRKLVQVVGSLTAGPYTFNNTSYAETSSGGRGEFVTWGDDLPCQAGGGDLQNGVVNGFAFAAVGLDAGTTSGTFRGAGGGQSAAAAERFMWAANGTFTSSVMTEGFHFITLGTRVNTSTGTLNTGSDPETTIITGTLFI